MTRTEMITTKDTKITKNRNGCDCLRALRVLRGLPNLRVLDLELPL
jgi:hypothetical protein